MSGVLTGLCLYILLYYTLCTTEYILHQLIIRPYGHGFFRPSSFFQPIQFSIYSAIRIRPQRPVLWYRQFQSDYLTPKFFNLQWQVLALKLVFSFSAKLDGGTVTQWSIGKISALEKSSVEINLASTKQLLSCALTHPETNLL